MGVNLFLKRFNRTENYFRISLYAAYQVCCGKIDAILLESVPTWLINALRENVISVGKNL